jgi:hypothetical protein
MHAVWNNRGHEDRQLLLEAGKPWALSRIGTMSPKIPKWLEKDEESKNPERGYPKARPRLGDPLGNPVLVGGYFGSSLNCDMNPSNETVRR